MPSCWVAGWLSEPSDQRPQGMRDHSARLAPGWDIEASGGRDQRPCAQGRQSGSDTDMFVGDEIRAEISATAAAARLANLIWGSSLIQASHAAWGWHRPGRTGAGAIQARSGAVPRAGAARRG